MKSFAKVQLQVKKQINNKFPAGCGCDFFFFLLMALNTRLLSNIIFYQISGLISQNKNIVPSFFMSTLNTFTP